VSIPTEKDVLVFLNERMEARGLPHRVTSIVVLPYVNPMWLANWDAPELREAGDSDVIDEEIREARWRYPQVLEG
jgi:hypothetical protein